MTSAVNAAHAYILTRDPMTEAVYRCDNPQRNRKNVSH